ncbi:hypothetical protein LCGC14_2524230, partial [marine sediment metagenome]
GQQVAAPPTPGYTQSGIDTPVLVPSIADAWRAIAQHLDIETPRTGRVSAGYPSPWKQHVDAGERNNALYVEACRLREAGSALQEAVGLLTARYTVAYDQGGMNERELLATVRSAFRPRKLRGWL